MRTASIVSGVIAAAAFYPVTAWMMDGITLSEVSGAVQAPSVIELYLCAIVGIVVTAFLFLLTDYYTSTRFGPVRKTADASPTGHATNSSSQTYVKPARGFGSSWTATSPPASKPQNGTPASTCASVSAAPPKASLPRAR